MSTTDPRTFEVLAPCAGQEPGAHVDASQLEGCNIDALITGAFLREVGGSSPPILAEPDAAPASPPASPPPDDTVHTS